MSHLAKRDLYQAKEQNLQMIDSLSKIVIHGQEYARGRKAGTKWESGASIPNSAPLTPLLALWRSPDLATVTPLPKSLCNILFFSRRKTISTLQLSPRHVEIYYPSTLCLIRLKRAFISYFFVLVGFFSAAPMTCTRPQQ